MTRFADGNWLRCFRLLPAAAPSVAGDVRGTTSTGAPAIAGNVVIIGNSGADLDARGYVSAYDVETGEFAWRFYTVPGDPKLGFEHAELEMAAKTWDPNSRWDIGLGGTVWDALVYDPELNLLYAGTGNAAVDRPHRGLSGNGRRSDSVPPGQSPAAARSSDHASSIFPRIRSTTESPTWSTSRRYAIGEMR